MNLTPVIIILILILISGCGGGQEGPPPPKKTTLPAQKGAGPPQAPPVVGTPAAFVDVSPPSPLGRERAYDPIGKPDPFQPPVLESPLEQAIRAGKVLPLEQFEVNEYQLVSTVIGARGNKAMVQDASGKGYLIAVGTKIGKNQGRVVAIGHKQVLVEEKIKDFLGRQRTKTVTLKIPQTL